MKKEIGQFTKQVGQMIRVVRRSQGVTLQELGDKIGMGRPSVINIEKGRQNISVEQLHQIAQALHAGILDFFAFNSIDEKDLRIMELEAQLKKKQESKPSKN